MRLYLRDDRQLLFEDVGEDLMKRLLTSCFGLGRLPVAPGTWGSLPSVITFIVLDGLGASPVVILIVMAGLVFAGSFVCVKFAPAIVSMTGKEDPGEVVADELAGQAVTFLVFSLLFRDMLSAGEVFAVAAAGFVFFRIFDILKPWPIRKLEKLRRGWGILADDLLAGVYAALVLLICLRLRDWVVS